MAVLVDVGHEESQKLQTPAHHPRTLVQDVLLDYLLGACILVAHQGIGFEALFGDLFDFILHLGRIQIDGDSLLLHGLLGGLREAVLLGVDEEERIGIADGQLHEFGLHAPLIAHVVGLLGLATQVITTTLRTQQLLGLLFGGVLFLLHVALVQQVDVVLLGGEVYAVQNEVL